MSDPTKVEIKTKDILLQVEGSSLVDAGSKIKDLFESLEGCAVYKNGERVDGDEEVSEGDTIERAPLTKAQN